MAVLSTNENLNKQIRVFCKVSEGTFSPVFLSERDKCLEYLNYELPEISVFYLDDPQIKMDPVLQAIKTDPWLLYGGIIGIYSQGEEAALEKKLKDHNVISLIHEKQLKFLFPRVLRILNQNRQILFQRGLQSHLIHSISGSFIIDNDPFDIKTYALLVSNYLFNTNYLKADDKQNLLVALMELLINAIEHGNCKISYEEKGAWLESGRDIFSLIRFKNKDPEIRKRKIYFSYRITPQKSEYVIRDEGSGFDWKKRKKKITEENYLDLHGRGIMMADHYVRGLKYNERGNEVGFEVPHQENESNTLPEAFTTEKEITFEDGGTVFTEGEESNFLYYIVSGKLNVISRDKVLSTLTPDDLFLGEMSFLLNNKRSAAVKSVGKSVLIKISKEAFVNVIKQKPHYGIFLARILAQRLDRLNRLI